MAKAEPPRSIATPKMRRGLKGYWTEVVRELKKVDWPPGREVNRLTGVVLAVCIFVVLVLYGLSVVAGGFVNILLGKGA